MAVAARNTAMTTKQLEKDQLEKWVTVLSELVDEVRAWAEARGWTTRSIEKKLADSNLGDYTARGIVLQKEATELLLEPIGRVPPGAEGVVDLYLLPAWDDIADLYYNDGRWRLHYVFPGPSPLGNGQDDELVPLTEEAFHSILEEMTRHAA
jgi:hypothetical protein